MRGLRHDLGSHQDGRKSTCESNGSPVLLIYQMEM